MFLVFFLSLLAWLIQIRQQKAYSKIDNRCQVTGCEMARSILDVSGSSSVAVEILETSAANTTLKDFYLPKEIYQGKSLSSIARAARAAVYFTNSKPLWVTGDFPEGAPVWLYRWGLATWIPAFLFWAGGGLVGEIAFWIWGSFFLLGFLSIPLERDLEHEVMLLMKNSQHFEVDELVRLKKCLRGYRLGAFSIPFRAAAWAVRKARISSSRESYR